MPPMQRFDKLALVLLLGALAMWVARPDGLATGGALVVAGVCHAMRLARWAGDRTGAEPLVWVLHLAYAFVPLGAVAIGIEGLSSGIIGMAAVQHLWMAGAAGLMTLAVMTRATLGHTGRPLTAGGGTVAIYLALVVSVLARLAAGVLPAEAVLLHALSGAAWIGAFGGFAVLYGPLMLRQKPAKTIPAA
jgi:uncharacterized protein involved in response to NO